MEQSNNKKFIVGEDMICPISKKHCDDECCTVGSECNISGNEISDCEKPKKKQKTKTLTIVIEVTNNNIQASYLTNDKFQPLEILGILESVKLMYNEQAVISDDNQPLKTK